MTSLSIVLTFFIVFSVGFPLLWRWNTRAGQRLTGMPREKHRLQTQRWLRLSGPVWLMLLLLVGHEVNEVHPVPQAHHAFWFGFITASSLFGLTFSLYNVVANWQEQNKRQQAQARKNASA